MKISYVLPIYNGQNSVAMCIRSLLEQKIEAHEIIVIDDASTDCTAHILSFFKDDVTLITNKERKGGAWCRNLGNSKATGDVIAVCDVDWYSPKRSEAIEEFFDTNKDKSIFYSGLNLRSSKHKHDQSVMEAFAWDFNSKCPISHPTIAYKKTVSDQLKYPEESLETDLFEFFLLDAHKKGFLFGGAQNPLMIKIEGDTNRDRTEARDLKVKKYAEYGIKVNM